MSRTTFHLFVAIMIGLFISAIGNGKENMPNMPLIKPHRTVTIKGNEDFETTKGFGENEPNIKMMNLMMVEGSGYEGMDMSHMDHSNKEQTIQKKALPSIRLSFQQTLKRRKWEVIPSSFPF